MPDKERPKTPHHVAAVGASAGGLEALQLFFENLPEIPGVAYVVIQHLSPDFKSLMAELLSRHTALPIRRVEEGLALEPETIYLIPPGKEMIVHEGRFSLTDREPGGVSHPVDVFLRSLARELGHRAVAVILSGTGTDGTRGLREVHTAGGLILAQQPESAAFDGMPRSAVATGLPHYVLPPQDMGRVLAESLLRSAQARVPAGEPPQRYAGIFAMLLERFGLDFRSYKPTTVGRRIERRMAIRQSEGVEDYLQLLAADRGELDQLYRDLLIGVTQFFRDPEAFSVLERRVVPGILARAGRREVRVWIPGCATGEEVYSLAILFAEQAELARGVGGIKLFATDVHRQSLTLAGQGLYPAEAVAGVASDRLARWFGREDGGFRVHPDLRRMVVFAEHNLVKDPPFTRMDLIACRNLLIYLQPAVQARILGLFHFALASQGTLFLGPSESLGDLDPEFEAVDRHWRVFTKRRDVRLPGHGLFAPAAFQGGVLGPAGQTLTPQQRIQKVAEQLLARFAPPAVLLDAKRRVLHVFGRAAGLLRRRSGRFESDVLQLLDGGLRVAAQSVLQRAQASRQSAVLERIAVSGPEGLREFRLQAEPFSEPGLPPHQYLLTFEDLTPPPPAPVPEGQGPCDPGTGAAARIGRLEAELAAGRESLRNTVQQLEASNEELQAANEELQSANEELQAANEELQSVNEELHTVNTEHERKILELDQANADMDNLLRSTDIGTVFADPDGLIRRLTPAAFRLLGLRPADLGRPVGEAAWGLEPGVDLAGMVRAVLDSGRPLEREVRSADGRDFLLRVLPCQNERGRVEGAVATFVDICRVKGAESALARTEVRLDEQGRLLDALIAAMGDGVILLNPEGRVVLFNPAAERILGRGPDLGTPENWPAAYGFKLPDQATPAPWEALPGARALRGEAADEEEFFVERPDMPGGVWVAASARPVRDARGSIIGGLAVLRDRTRGKAAELQAERARREAETASRAKSEFLATMSHEIRTPLNAVINLTELVLGTRLDAGQRESLEAVREAGSHLLRIINDILDISRIEAGRLPVESVDFDLEETVEGAVRPLLPAIRAKGLSFALEFEPGLLPRTLRGDPARLRQILLNLVGNARKFTEHGGIGLRVARADQEGLLLFSVADTGPGIPPEEQEAVFELFVQAEGGAARRFGGTGLGLAICRRLTGLLGGRIWVESAPGKGSTFRFTVRLEPGDPEAVRARREAEEARVQARRARAADGAAPTRCRILVVEDNPVNVRVAGAFLDRLGHGHEAVPDGTRALSALRRSRSRGHPFDLVLMDLELPGMDGRETTRRIRSGEAGDALRGIPVVAVTAHASAEHRASARAAGMDGFLTKPLDIEEMHQILEDLLGPCLMPGPPPEEAPAAPAGEVSEPDREGPEPAVDHALLDLPGLLTRCAGERALARSLLEAFLEDLPERLGTFAGPEERGDLPGLAEAAHSLKGSSLTLGAVGVSALAAALEERARAGDRGEALRLLRGLRAAAGKTLEAVRRALGQDGESPVV